MTWRVFQLPILIECNQPNLTSDFQLIATKRIDSTFSVANFVFVCRTKLIQRWRCTVIFNRDSHFSCRFCANTCDFAMRAKTRRNKKISEDNKIYRFLSCAHILTFRIAFVAFGRFIHSVIYRVKALFVLCANNRFYSRFDPLQPARTKLTKWTRKTKWKMKNCSLDNNKSNDRSNQRNWCRF